MQLTKSLGQNFLHDQNQLRADRGGGGIDPHGQGLEIGPGLGPLTDCSWKRPAKCWPSKRTGGWWNFCANGSRNPWHPGRGPADKPVNLSCCMTTRWNFCKREPRDWSDWKLVANLPYSVASPILVELAPASRAPKMMVATLQLEVARRLMAQTDDDDYGVLTLLVQLDFAAARLVSRFRRPVFSRRRTWIRPAWFWAPRPAAAAGESARRFSCKIVKRGFSQRRKMMLKLLKQDWPKERLEAAFGVLEISPQERAEKLSLEQFVQLTGLLAE